MKHRCCARWPGGVAFASCSTACPGGTEERGIPKIDVENMLRRCRVSMIEERDGELTRRVEGTDVNGRGIVAIVVPYEEDGVIKIITGWAK